MGRPICARKAYLQLDRPTRRSDSSWPVTREIAGVSGIRSCLTLGLP